MILLAIGLHTTPLPLPALLSTLAPPPELLGYLSLAAGLTAIMILHTRLLRKP